MSDPVIDASAILSMGLSMVIVIGAVVGLGWLYSRMRFSGKGGDDVINVVASRALGPKERLLLVQVADKQLLVGFTASQVQTLHTFDKPIVDESALSETIGFAHRLRTAVRGAVK